MTPIVFLHIPKTAGQTVHNEICRNLPADAVSPVRVHTQPSGGTQYPKGFRFYSGHLDWPEPDAFRSDPFVFTILRDPRERIASFYFYLLKEAYKLSAEELEKPHNLGKKTILTQSADDYFFAGNDMWTAFIRDHFDNTYCRYLASGCLRGWSATREMSVAQLAEAAKHGIERLDRIYHVNDLRALEVDLRALFGFQTSLVGNFQNAGQNPGTTARWPRLLKLLDRDASRRKLESFIAMDEAMMDRLNLTAAA